jgi:hypothetical protein
VLLAALALLAVLVSHGAGGSFGGLLYLMPALALAALLLGGRYPGERALERLRQALAPCPRARAASSLRPRRCPDARLGGGRLIAVSLGGRAPPLHAGLLL